MNTTTKQAITTELASTSNNPEHKNFYIYADTNDFWDWLVETKGDDAFKLDIGALCKMADAYARHINFRLDLHSKDPIEYLEAELAEARDDADRWKARYYELLNEFYGTNQ